MISLRSEKVRALVLPVLFLVAVQCLVGEGKANVRQLSVCSKSKEGNQTLYRKVSGDDGVVICIKNSGQYIWTFLDGSSTLGENFNPAKDCSDIVDNLPEAKDGFYWIKHDNGKPLKGWCDTHTDGGGFLLIGMKNSPVTWNVPSNENPVDPMGPPHWSSKFGDVNVQDFAIQISTTKNFKDTKAHWSYRLKINRALGNLFGVGSGGCTNFHSGIGNVSYVKDILTETVVTTKFNCSKFGPHQNINLGWCCACFGPKGGRDHYCSRKCKAVNVGTILTGQVYVWYWIRMRMPKRLWKRCMEFKMKTAAGKFDTYYIDKNTGIVHKGACSEQFQTFLNEGTLLVKNKESFKNLPPVPGLLSYREDNKKLYVNKGNIWDAIGSEKETQNLEKNITAKLQSLENKLKKIEGRFNEIMRKSCKAILAANKFAISGIYSIQPAAGKLFQVYCDMETHGGGWTLVYSYTFTNYNSFSSPSNAVTPRPNWPASAADVPISTTPPLSESSLGAVDWNLWKNIGQEFMIKSNINDWIVCQPNGGSLVTKTQGSMSCQNIKNVATACSGVAPYIINWGGCGPTLSASNTYYLFDGNTGGCWPVHNPCGRAKDGTPTHQKKGVSNPGGQIYVR